MNTQQEFFPQPIFISYCIRIGFSTGLILWAITRCARGKSVQQPGPKGQLVFCTLAMVAFLSAILWILSLQVRRVGENFPQIFMIAINKHMSARIHVCIALSYRQHYIRWRWSLSTMQFSKYVSKMHNELEFNKEFLLLIWTIPTCIIYLPPCALF